MLYHPLPLKPLTDKVLSIKENTWLVGRCFILTRHLTAEAAGPGAFPDGSGFWTVDPDIPSPLPTGPDVTEVPGVIEGVYRGHDPHDASFVWRLGSNSQLLLKAKHRAHTNPTEIANMKFLATLDKKEKLSFAFPETYYAAFDRELMYSLEKQIKGVPLRDLWQNLSPETKDKATTRIADAVVELSRATSDSAFTGAYGKPLSTGDMVLTSAESDDVYHERRTIHEVAGISAENYRQIMGGDYVDEPSVFTHSDLTDRNILLDPEDPEYLGLIDWEHAGYYPRRYITSKMTRYNGGVYFSEVTSKLEARGFPSFADCLYDWADERYKEVLAERALRGES